MVWACWAVSSPSVTHLHSERVSSYVCVQLAGYQFWGRGTSNKPIRYMMLACDSWDATSSASKFQPGFCEGKGLLGCLPVLTDFVSILRRMKLLCWLLKPKMHMFKHLLKRTRNLRPLPEFRRSVLEMYVLGPLPQFRRNMLETRMLPFPHVQHWEPSWLRSEQQIRTLFLRRGYDRYPQKSVLNHQRPPHGKISVQDFQTEARLWLIVA